MAIEIITGIVLGGFVLVALSGLRVVRPFQMGLIERFGKLRKKAIPGLSWIIPFVDRMIKVNMTEQMVDIKPQTVITRDKLNAVVDAVVYYKILSAAKAMYNVDNHEEQLTSLARTTLRAVIGKMTLSEANENRDQINIKVEKILDKETDSYGVDILRVELQKIQPPQDVQESMNMVVKAEQEKIAALDLAVAEQTKADGFRMAAIKKAEGEKRAQILEAEGEAQAIEKVAGAEAERIKLVCQSQQKNFKNEAQIYKKLETTEKALSGGNTKYVMDSKSGVSLVLTDTAGVTPIKDKGKGKGR